MNNALRMFQALKFSLLNSSETLLLYKYATDYDEVSVHFDLEQKTYLVSWNRWVDNSEETIVSMNARPQNTKHSSRYGHWQREIFNEISVELHKAIHQQMRELGWINE